MNKFILMFLIIPAITLAEGTWEQRAPAPLAHSEFAVAEVNGEIYLMGGYPSTQVTQRSVQIYNVKNDNWRMGPDLPLPTNHGAASVVDGVIYLIGGGTGSSRSPGGVGLRDTVYAYDPLVGKWESKSPMPTVRRAIASAVLDGKIYVAGGQPARENDFAAYDPATDSWETLPGLPSTTNHMIAGAVAGNIHVFGGRVEGTHKSELIADNQIYDPVTRKWELGPPLPKPRSGNNGVLAYGCFHVWGGEGGGENHDQMFADHDVYDPVKKAWISLADMPKPIHGVTGAAFVNGMIFSPGGGDKVGGVSGTHLNQVYKPEIKCE
jgi:N-acetylneuraminic acid mutarotase